MSAAPGRLDHAALVLQVLMRAEHSAAPGAPLGMAVAILSAAASEVLPLHHVYTPSCLHSIMFTLHHVYTDRCDASDGRVLRSLSFPSDWEVPELRTGVRMAQHSTAQRTVAHIASPLTRASEAMQAAQLHPGWSCSPLHSSRPRVNIGRGDLLKHWLMFRARTCTSLSEHT